MRTRLLDRRVVAQLSTVSPASLTLKRCRQVVEIEIDISRMAGISPVSSRSCAGERFCRQCLGLCEIEVIRVRRSNRREHGRLVVTELSADIRAGL